MLLKIAHVDDAHDPRYVVVQEPASYTIGFDPHNDIALTDSTVEPRHARLTLAEGRIVVEPLEGPHGAYHTIFVDEQPIRGTTEVALGQWIQLGETVLSVLRGDRAPKRNHDELRSPSDEEQGFLAALRSHPDDDETRLVYADWLEAAGCPMSAGYLRLELAGAVDLATSELVERATLITKLEWRVLICRGPIGHCLDRAPHCPGRWHMLAPTRELFTRDCTTCGHAVHYCPDLEVIARHGEQRARVVFDASVLRWRGRLAYFRRIDPDLNIPRTGPTLFPTDELERLIHDRAHDTVGHDDDDVF